MDGSGDEEGTTGLCEDVRREEVEEKGKEQRKHQKTERGEGSAIKRIKCSLCSQKTYGAPANSKSCAEPIEVRVAKGSEECGRFLGDCPRFEVMRTHTAEVLCLSLVDHLLYIILGISTCQHDFCLHRLIVAGATYSLYTVN